MTANCPSCRFDDICPGLFKALQQEMPTDCEQYKPADTGVLSDRNWT